MPGRGDSTDAARPNAGRAPAAGRKRQGSRDSASPYGYSKPRNSSSRKSPNTKHTASKRQWTEEVTFRQPAESVLIFFLALDFARVAGGSNCVRPRRAAWSTEVVQDR